MKTEKNLHLNLEFPKPRPWSRNATKWRTALVSVAERFGMSSGLEGSERCSTPHALNATTSSLNPHSVIISLADVAIMAVPLSALSSITTKTAEVGVPGLSVLVTCVSDPNNLRHFSPLSFPLRPRAHRACPWAARCLGR